MHALNNPLLIQIDILCTAVLFRYFIAIDEIDPRLRFSLFFRHTFECLTFPCDRSNAVESN